MFNKEKRKQAKATKEYLSEQIKPREPYEKRMEKKAKREKREKEAEERQEPIRNRIKSIHAGEPGGDIAQMGSDLLYIGHLSSVHVQVQDQFSTPEKCMTRWTVRGKHDKEFLGMAPTGREVTFTGVTVSYFSAVHLAGVMGTDGGEPAVTQEYHYWDMVALLQQIQAP